MRVNKDLAKGKELAELAAECAQEKKAEHVSILDLRNTAAPAEWFVLCQGENTVHARAIFDEVLDGLHKEGIQPWHVEGKAGGRWLLIDYVDVVVHVMIPEAREYYALENLWTTSKKAEEKKNEIW